MNHTCNYEIGVSREIEVEGKVYYVDIDLSVDFNGNADAQNVEITDSTIEGDDGASIPHTFVGKRIEKIVVEDSPALTQAIDDAIWEEIADFAENNSTDISRDVEDDYESMRGDWNERDDD
jgi:hypothetical protein